jgi:hypothetical protein
MLKTAHRLDPPYYSLLNLDINANSRVAKATATMAKLKQFGVTPTSQRTPRCAYVQGLCVQQTSTAVSLGPHTPGTKRNSTAFT